MTTPAHPLTAPHQHTQGIYKYHVCGGINFVDFVMTYCLHSIRMIEGALENIMVKIHCKYYLKIVRLSKNVAYVIVVMSFV